MWSEKERFIFTCPFLSHEAYQFRTYQEMLWFILYSAVPSKARALLYSRPALCLFASKLIKAHVSL